LGKLKGGQELVLVYVLCGSVIVNWGKKKRYEGGGKGKGLEITKEGSPLARVTKLELSLREKSLNKQLSVRTFTRGLSRGEGCQTGVSKKKKKSKNNAEVAYLGF